MDEEIYYKEQIRKNIRAILEILTYVVFGLFLVFVCNSLVFGEGTDIEPEGFARIIGAWPLLVIPYGWAKTSRGLIVLRSACTEIWFLWIFYILIKLMAAMFYGAFAVPILLLGNIFSAVDYRAKLKKAEDMRIKQALENVTYLVPQSRNNNYNGRDYYG